MLGAGLGPVRTMVLPGTLPAKMAAVATIVSLAPSLNI